MPGFWISRVIQGWPIFVNISGSWVFQDCYYTQASEFPGLHKFAYFRKYDGSKYVSAWIKEGFWIFQKSEYVRFLHMQALKFWISLKKLFWLWQHHEFDWSKFHRVLNMLLVLNMPEPRICQSPNAWISLNMA